MKKKCLHILSLCLFGIFFFGDVGYASLSSKSSIARPPLSLKSSQNKKSTVEIHDEIWSRLRSRFHLQGAKNHPAYQQQLKRFKSQAYVNELVNNASPYLYHILEEVEKRNMPSEIALLPMVESTFNPHANSPKGAAGLWQLMPATGRLYGLKQNTWNDPRRDFYASTNAALDHLQYLYKRFNGNWLLAIAAYNVGEGKVERAIKHNKAHKKPTDFWSLNLPKETSQFVPKLLAIATIVNAPHQYGVNLPHVANKPVFTRINTGKAIDLASIAKLADVPEKQLHQLNPNLSRKTMDPNGPFELVVPHHCANTLASKIKSYKPVKIATVDKNKHHISNGDVVKHLVKKGDNIGKIAHKYNTTVPSIRERNHLPNDVIVIGKTLEIPVIG